MVKQGNKAGPLSMIALMLGMGFLAGCFGLKTYPNDLQKNLHVHTSADSGWFLSTVRTAVDVHRVGSDCTTEYAGTVQLADGMMGIGLPPDQWSRLVFVFATSSFLVNSSGTITYETWLRPKAGHTYEVEVSYQDDLYNVSIHETPPDSPAPHRVQRHTSDACRLTSVHG